MTTFLPTTYSTEIKIFCLLKHYKHTKTVTTWRVSARLIKLYKQKKLSWYDTTDSVDCICKPASSVVSTDISGVGKARKTCKSNYYRQ